MFVLVDLLTERKEGFQYLVSKYGDAGAREVFEVLQPESDSP